MRGAFFQKPLEFRLLVEGESWNQGDPIAGSLSVMNHGAEEIPHHEMAIFLACGELGKVRLKSPDAFRAGRKFKASADASKAVKSSGFGVVWDSFPRHSISQLLKSPRSRP